MLFQLARELETAILRDGRELVWRGGHSGLVREIVNVMLDFPETPNGFKLEVRAPVADFAKVILLSGGMDSTVMWELNSQEQNKLGMYVNLGHPYAPKEMAALGRLGLPFLEVDYKLQFESWGHIIPTRNFVLLALAELNTKHEGEIWLGAVQGESAEDKGDKSELFFRLFEELVWRAKNKKVFIRTLKAKTKNDWLQWYLSTTGRTDILDTVTCFSGGGTKGCGCCQACVRKWIAMRYCGIKPNVIIKYFEVEPYVGGREHIRKYWDALHACLLAEDFTHYSKERCVQDLAVIKEYEIAYLS
jgi:7-cyano-7-deazaguanine synthase in queuosine biosynthesis